MLTADGRVVMVSGANRGIGLAVARTLAARGYVLSLGARDLAAIDTAGLAGGQPLCQRWDATDPPTSAAWVEATLERFGRIDAVVLNAGVILRAGLEDGSEDDMDAMWEVNFKGPLRLIRAALPALKTGGDGRVVNIVSLSGKRLLGEGNLGYAASKFAAMALTHAIRRNGWRHGVRATAVCPGMVDTDMVADITVPEGEFKITPDAIAETVAYALALPREAAVAEILVNSRLEALF